MRSINVAHHGRAWVAPTIAMACIAGIADVGFAILNDATENHGSVIVTIERRGVVVVPAMRAKMRTANRGIHAIVAGGKTPPLRRW
jgi:hypothetical protein